MKYEVENKYAVDDRGRMERLLQAAGARLGPAVRQSDLYFRHPARDFAATDEALRIRSVGDQAWITYKGPKVDRATKTRREIELPLGPGPECAGQYAELLGALSFQPVAAVDKSRQETRFPWQEFSVVAALDQVDELGDFIELEIAADEKDLAAAQQAILALASEWGLGEPIRRSYLAMVLGVDEPSV